MQNNPLVDMRAMLRGCRMFWKSVRELGATLAVPKAAFSTRALFTGLSKRDAFGKSPRQLTTARLKMDLDGRGDFEENWAVEIENIIFLAFLRVSKRESLARVRRGLRSGSFRQRYTLATRRLNARRREIDSRAFFVSVQSFVAFLRFAFRRCRTFWKNAFENSALLVELMVHREFL